MIFELDSSRGAADPCCDAIDLAHSSGVSLMELILHGERAVVIMQLSPRDGDPRAYRIATLDGDVRRAVTVRGGLGDPAVLAPVATLLAAVHPELRARMHGIVLGRRPPLGAAARMFLDAERAIAFAYPPQPPPAGSVELPDPVAYGRYLYGLCLDACEAARGDRARCVVACAPYLWS